jgi:hypothetical protein
MTKQDEGSVFAFATVLAQSCQSSQSKRSLNCQLRS